VAYPPHEPAVADLIATSDVMLAVGTDLDAMMTRQFRVSLPPTLIQVDVEPSHIGMNYPVDIPVVGRAEEVVKRLIDRLGSPTRPVGAQRAEETRRRAWADQGQGAFGAARTFLEQLDSALPEDAIVVSDMAVAGYWAAGYLTLAPHRQLLYPMGWGTLGSGLPAAIGAAIAGAGRRVLCIAGDAGLLYAVGELATVAEHDLPITLIVVDDGGYGMLRFAGQARFGRDFGMDLRSPDFAALAASFGIEARVASLDAEVVAREMRDAVSAPGPSLLVLRGRLEPPRMSRLWE
jgi:acetolactate synthase-1/2/3 large subunit